MHSIEVQNLLFTNFNASIYTKKKKRNANMLNYWDISLSELKVVVDLESQQGQQNDSSVIDQLNDF